MYKNSKARLTDFQKILRANGVLESVKLIYSTFVDFLFDSSMGMQTQKSKFVPEPFVLNGERIEGSYYLPTRGLPFKKFLKQQTFSKSAAFVDIGCGRGRVLWIAKEAGFKKVIGIEIDEELSLAAKNNLTAKGLADGRDFEIHFMNAADFIPQADQNIFYFYGPYMADKDLAQVLETLRRKKSQTGLDQYFIYHCNFLNETLVDNSGFLRIGDERHLGNRFLVYKTS